MQQRLETDFAIMCGLARAAARLPVLRDLRFDDSVQMFGVPLHQQLDLRIEAAHLERFRRNFWCARSLPHNLERLCLNVLHPPQVHGGAFGFLRSIVRHRRAGQRAA